MVTDEGDGMAERTWFWLKFYLFHHLNWSSHPILFICLQLICKFGRLFKDLSSDYPIPSSSSVSRLYVNKVNSLNTSHLIISFLPLHLSPARTWTWSIVLRNYIWSFSSIVSSSYVNLISRFKILRWSSFPSVSSLYEYLVNWFKTSHLIILFIYLQRVCQLILLIWSFWSCNPSSSCVSREYLNFANWIIPSHWHPLHLSPEIIWTRLIILRPHLIILLICPHQRVREPKFLWIYDNPSSSFISRAYVNFDNCFKTLYDYPILFVRLQSVREPG